MKEDFTRVVGECDLKGVQRASYHLRLPRRCNFLPGASVPPDEVLKCGTQLASPSRTLVSPRALGTPRCSTKLSPVVQRLWQSSPTKQNC